MHTRLKSIYHNMKTRCTNSNYDKYQYYGGKGVSICNEWMDSYTAFEEWALSNGYADDLTLERKDVNGNYTPENCCWVSRKDQANNRTSNRYIEYHGSVKSLSQWCDELGLSYDTISQRIRVGWSPVNAFETPTYDTHTPKLITFNGKTQRLYEWALELNIPYKTLYNRFDRGWSAKDALTIPLGGRRND